MLISQAAFKGQSLWAFTLDAPSATIVLHADVLSLWSGGVTAKFYSRPIVQKLAKRTAKFHSGLSTSERAKLRWRGPGQSDMKDAQYLLQHPKRGAAVCTTTP